MEIADAFVLIVLQTNMGIILVAVVYNTILKKA